MNERDELTRRKQHPASMRGAEEKITFEIHAQLVANDDELVAVCSSEMRQRRRYAIRNRRRPILVGRSGRDANHDREEPMRYLF